MKQRSRKLAGLCITAAIIATANTTTAVARESKDQVVEQEEHKLHIGAGAAALEAAETAMEEIRAAEEAGEALPEAKEEPELAVAQVDSYLHVRNQPGMEGEIIGKLYNDSVGEIIGEENGWLKITSGSVEGYIKEEYAIRGEEGAAKAEEVGVRQAKVEADALRLREEATTESGIITLLPQEEVVQVEEELEGWVKVDAGAEQGYVSADYVDVYTVHPVAESREEEEERLRREEEARLAEEEAARAQAEAEAEASARQTLETARESAPARGSESKRGEAKPVPESSGSTQASSGLGQQIANYALQFVGNPYVYGGTSLTNGADCSGFVMSVYKNFGISLPRTSGEQGQCGTDVGGLGNARPGDLVSYSGHIGIYIGNGQIVHASSAKTGIKVSNAGYRPILSVRRIV